MRKFIRSRLSAKASDESFCCCGKVEELAEEAYLSSKKSSSRENLRASECVPPPGDKENQPIASSSKGYTPPVFPTHRLYVPPSPRKQAPRNSRSLGNLEAIRKEKRKVAQKHVAFVEDGPSERCRFFIDRLCPERHQWEVSSDSTISAFAQFTPASGYGRFKGTSLSSKDCLPSGTVCLPLRKQASLRVNSESETTIARVLLAQSKHNRAAEDSGKLVAKPKRFRVVLGKKTAQGEAERSRTIRARSVYKVQRNHDLADAYCVKLSGATKSFRVILSKKSIAEGGIADSIVFVILRRHSRVPQSSRKKDDPSINPNSLKESALDEEP
ncbi:hypothetical protein PGTUg99_016763 [Puccinia graminis f. sp. tritici]|uniref:Uncharacterized protein n=1 Tax=Puccinia graminis f. sp. tritici TaxID=56615 RepID=A0A5B0RXI5_PUCGR|nr:hypothetical protein PGTUg99_016763 [Puccinia graminis f. sp. tritici]